LAVSLYQDVEKARQLRSRLFVVLTNSLVRSARPSACGLAGQAFLNILIGLRKNLLINLSL
jgi:hypothetical protein